MLKNRFINVFVIDTMSTSFKLTCLKFWPTYLNNGSHCLWYNILLGQQFLAYAKQMNMLSKWHVLMFLFEYCVYVGLFIEIWIELEIFLGTIFSHIKKRLTLMYWATRINLIRKLVISSNLLFYSLICAVL